jgi:hypothetical protein
MIGAAAGKRADYASSGGSNFARQREKTLSTKAVNNFVDRLGPSLRNPRHGWGEVKMTKL